MRGFSLITFVALSIYELMHLLTTILEWKKHINWVILESVLQLCFSLIFSRVISNTPAAFWTAFHIIICPTSHDQCCVVPYICGKLRIYIRHSCIHVSRYFLTKWNDDYQETLCRKCYSHFWKWRSYVAMLAAWSIYCKWRIWCFHIWIFFLYLAI